MEDNCLGLDIAFDTVGSETSELATKGAIKFTVQVLGNTPLVIEDGDMVIAPADGEVCLFDNSCCKALVRNLRMRWDDAGISSPTKQARIKRIWLVPA